MNPGGGGGKKRSPGPQGMPPSAPGVRTRVNSSILHVFVYVWFDTCCTVFLFCVGCDGGGGAHSDGRGVR